MKGNMNKLQIPTLVFLLLLAGCSALAPGADPVVVRAEQTAGAAKKTLDNFFQFERANRDSLWKLDHGIKHTADILRVRAPASIKALRAATKTYKAVKSQEHIDAVDLWLAEVAALVGQAQTTLAQSTQKLGRNP